jgi:zinc transporter 1
MIASVHIQVNLPQANRTKRYHSIARAIRTCLHAYGIHSSTIQPEFADDLPLPPGKVASNLGDDEDAPLLQDGAKGCLFECVGGGDCEDSRCCDGSDGKDKSGNGNAYGSSGSSHSH